MTTEEGQSKQQSKNGRRKGPWSQAEIERLRRLYGLKPDAQIARELQRSVESVRRLAKRIFAGETRTGPWSAREVKELKNYLGASEISKIAEILRRTENDVLHKIEELQTEVRSGPWTSKDVQTLKRLYGNRTNADLVLILGRSESDILTQARQLCLAKDKGFRRRIGTAKPTRMPRWSDEDKELLRQLYRDYSNLEIARRLNRTVKSVVSKAHDMGLKKSEARLRTMGRENVQVRYSSSGEHDESAEMG